MTFLRILLATASASLTAAWGPVIDESYDYPDQDWGRTGFPDPYPWRHSSSARDWYIFGTSKKFFRTRSFDKGDFELFWLDLDLSASGSSQIWAFRPYEDSQTGEMHAYATLIVGGSDTVVAHLLPKSGSRWSAGKPITSWVFDRIIVKSVSYDSNVITDPDTGDRYFVWNHQFGAGSYPDCFNAIMTQRMLHPGQLDPQSEPIMLLRPAEWYSEFRDGVGSMKIVESVQVRKLESRWLLMYSVGDYDEANYRIGVAWSPNMLGPYERIVQPDPHGVWPDATTNHSEVRYLLQSEKPDWPNYAGEWLNGPGIGSIVDPFDNGTFKLLFHARRQGQTHLGGNHRYVWTAPLRMNVDMRQPMAEWLLPVLPGSVDHDMIFA